MKKLYQVGTEVVATRDLRPPMPDKHGRPFVVLAGTLGRITRVGPDAKFGWYVVDFGDGRETLQPVSPAGAGGQVEYAGEKENTK